MLASGFQLLCERRLFVNHITFLNKRILLGSRIAPLVGYRSYATTPKKPKKETESAQSSTTSLGLTVPEKPRRTRGPPPPRPPPRPQPIRVMPESVPERQSYARPVIAKWVDGTPPRKVYIDLDRPHEERWNEVLKWATEPLRRVLMNPTYTSDTNFPYFFKNKGMGILRALERRYYFSNDQYEEIQAIANLADVPFDKLLYFNHFINSLFSCTSGTVPSSETGNLLHFRTLECGIGLPELLMEAHYMRNSEVVAKAIHHFGHVCFTTGVRKGLSLSLNANLVHALRHEYSLQKWMLNDPWTILTRNFLLSEECPSLSEVVKKMTSGHPPSVFPVFCDGYEATGIEYEHLLPTTLTVSQEHQSIVMGNHFDLPPGFDMDLHDIMFQSNKKAASQRLESKKRVNAMEQYILRALERPGSTGVTVQELSSWLTRSPVKNNSTLLVCIMDPVRGDIPWSAAYQVANSL